MTNWSLGNVVWCGVMWSGLVCKDSQDELVYAWFDGSSDDSYGIYAYSLNVTPGHERTHEKWKEGQLSAWAKYTICKMNV